VAEDTTGVETVLETGTVIENVAVVLESVADASEVLVGSAVDRAHMADLVLDRTDLDQHSHTDLHTGWLWQADRYATEMNWWDRARRTGRLAHSRS
jgi:hypothetical protein